MFSLPPGFRAISTVALLIAAACQETTFAPQPERVLTEAAPDLFLGLGSLSTGIPLEPATLLTTVTNPVSGDDVEVLNGGYGSAVATAPWLPGLFYLMTDRGPNIDVTVGGVTGKGFPVPKFTPQIGVFRRHGSQLKKVQDILLRDESCRPLTGLPIPSGQSGSTGEVPFTLSGDVLPFDPNGLDSEGLTLLPDGTLWTSDEYGPFLTHFDRRGCTIKRVGPGVEPRALPLVFSKRRANRGMEGLTSVLGGRYLIGAMQSPLDNPTSAGRASRLTRIVVYNTKTGATKQFAYLTEAASLTNSEILALSPNRYLVLERDGNFPGAGTAVKKLYLIDLKGATDISDPSNGATGLLVNGKTLEELTAGAPDPAGALRAAGVEPVQKKLAVDLLLSNPGYPHDKAEGIALVDPWTVAVSNDDDFGVLDGPGGLIQKVIPGTTATDFGEVVFVRLPFWIRLGDFDSILQ